MPQELHFPSAVHRRRLLAAAALAPWCSTRAQAPTGASGDAGPLPKRSLQFPRDLGSHPDTAIEWWYVTGELRADRRRFGFQLTFFRSRVPVAQGMRSAFAARQLIFAHAAITDVAGQRLLHDQRIARSSGQPGVDLAFASTRDTELRLRDWSLVRQTDAYVARAGGEGFEMALNLRQTQPLLLQGDDGLSRKGPDPAHASYYYSVPHLQVSGALGLGGQRLGVTGRAWLDHEWSQSILPAQAVGWDWIGIHLDDGSALTAFRLRDAAGAAVWAGGSWRAAGAAKPRIFDAADLRFSPKRLWKSPASGASYPVQWELEFRPPAGHAGEAGVDGPPRWCRLQAVIDAQELDSRASTGAIYWEGLSDLLDAQGRRIGCGYLEMTGYAAPLQL